MIRSLVGSSSNRFVKTSCSLFHRSYCISCQPLISFKICKQGPDLLKSLPFAFRAISYKKRKPPPPPPPVQSLKATLSSPKVPIEVINEWLRGLAAKSNVVVKASDFFHSLQPHRVFESFYDPSLSIEQNYQNISNAYTCWIISSYLLESQNSDMVFSSLIRRQILPDIFKSTNLPQHLNIKFSILMSEIMKNIMLQMDIRSRLSIALVVYFHVHALYLQEITSAEIIPQHLQDLHESFLNDGFSLLGDFSQLGKVKITVIADIIFGTLQRQQRPNLDGVRVVSSSLNIRMFDKDDATKPLTTYEPFSVNEAQCRHLDNIMQTHFSSEDCLDSRMTFLARAGNLGFSDYVLHFIRQARSKEDKNNKKKLLLGTTVFNNAILSQALQGRHDNITELVSLLHDEFDEYHEYVTRKWQFDRHTRQVYDYNNDEKTPGKWERRPLIGMRFITFDYYLCGISHYLHQPLRKDSAVGVDEQAAITKQIVDFLNSLPIDPPVDTFESIAYVIDGFDDEELFHLVIDKYFDYLEFVQRHETIWMIGGEDMESNTVEMKHVQQSLKDEKRRELLTQRIQDNDAGLKLRKQVFELNQTKTVDIFTRNLIRMNCAHEARQLLDRAAALDIKIDPGTITVILQRLRQSNHARNLQHIFKSIPAKFKVARQYEHAVELTHLLFQSGQLYHGARGLKSIYESIENKLSSIKNDHTLTEDEQYYALEDQLRFLVSILKRMLKYLKGAKNAERRRGKRFDEDLATNTSIMIMELLLKYLPPEAWSRQRSQEEEEKGYATVHKRLVTVLRHFKRLCWHREDAEYLFRIFQEQLKYPRIHDILAEVDEIVKQKEERQLLFEEKQQEKV